MKLIVTEYATNLDGPQHRAIEDQIKLVMQKMKMGHKLYGKDYELNFTLLVGNPQVTITKPENKKLKK